MELQIQAEIHQAWYNYEAEKKKVFQYKAGVLEDSREGARRNRLRYLKRGETTPNILDVLVRRTYKFRSDGIYLGDDERLICSFICKLEQGGLWLLWGI